MIRTALVRAERWVIEDPSVFLSFAKLCLLFTGFVAVIFGAPLYLAAGRPWERWTHPIPTTTLDLRAWRCSASVVEHHDPVHRAKLGWSAAYDVTICTQWTARE